MRKLTFAEGEFYHVYNRGTDKRTIFSDLGDFSRFLESVVEFNAPDPIGSLYEQSFRTKRPGGGGVSKVGRLVNIVAYCLNQNHYHFVLEQVSEKGIEKFMQRLGTGYTMYFNNKYDRTGSLFQGTFKAVHIDSNPYLLHASAYVNLNSRVHQLGGLASKSSWEEYVAPGGISKGICSTGEVLGQFSSPRAYKEFAEKSVEGTLARRGVLDEALLLE